MTGETYCSPIVVFGRFWVPVFYQHFRISPEFLSALLLTMSAYG